MYKYTFAAALLLVSAPSAIPAESFPAYRSYEDTAPDDWRALNERMRVLGGHRGHVQADAAQAQATGAPPAQATGAPHAHGDSGSTGTSPAGGAHRGMHGHMHGQMHGQGRAPAHGHMHSHKEKP